MFIDFIWELIQMRLLREFGSVVKYFGPVFQRSNNKGCGHCKDLHPMHHQAFFDGEMVNQKRHCAFYLFLFMWQCSLYLQCSLFEQHTKLGAFWWNVLLNLIWLTFRYSEKAENLFKNLPNIFDVTFFCILGKNNKSKQINEIKLQL